MARGVIVACCFAGLTTVQDRFAGEKQQILEHALEEIATIKQMQ